MTAFPREIQQPWEKKSYMPLDLICRWCEHYEHDEIGVWWVNFRCGLDHTDIAMWGTCDVWEMGPPKPAPERSAHDRAALLERKGSSYHMTRDEVLPK